MLTKQEDSIKRMLQSKSEKTRNLGAFYYERLDIDRKRAIYRQLNEDRNVDRGCSPGLRYLLVYEHLNPDAPPPLTTKKLMEYLKALYFDRKSKKIE